MSAGMLVGLLSFFDEPFLNCCSGYADNKRCVIKEDRK